MFNVLKKNAEALLFDTGQIETVLTGTFYVHAFKPEKIPKSLGLFKEILTWKLAMYIKLYYQVTDHSMWKIKHTETSREQNRDRCLQSLWMTAI